MGVGVVDRLVAGLGDGDDGERGGAQQERRCEPGRPSGGAVARDGAQVRGPGRRDAAASASSSAGSTSAAMATSRLVPMPPNALPASRAPSASTNRTSASSPTTTSRSPQPESGTRSATSGTRNTASTMAATTATGAMPLSGLAASLSTGADATTWRGRGRAADGGPASVLEARLDPLGDAQQQRRQQQANDALRHDELYGLATGTPSSSGHQQEHDDGRHDVGHVELQGALLEAPRPVGEGEAEAVQRPVQPLVRWSTSLR